MAIEIKAPALPESVPDGTIATWYKKEGDTVSRDELVVDIETDKVVMEVVAPADGVLKNISKQEGDTIVSGDLLASLEEGTGEESKSGGTSKNEDAGSDDSSQNDDRQDADSKTKTEGSKDTGSKKESGDKDDADEDLSESSVLMSPAARKLVEENDLEPSSIKATGKDGRVTKEDVVNFMDQKGSADKSSGGSTEGAEQKQSGSSTDAMPAGERPEQRVPMTRLRAKVAERLLQATQTTAMLTTFNEVDMSKVMALRNQYKDLFEKKHDGTKLGFMSFFVRASVEALKRFPAVNASIDENDMIYHGYQDIGVAVSSPRGLVVPVLRNADSLGFADIESSIREFGVKAKDGKLSIDEMTGGTFTISNGGIFGSLLSTPILNPPQTAILGMHKIQERPMAVNGEVKVLPMMYLALSYDHRMIDGKEAVQFLVTIKELLEDPARIFLEV